MRRLLLPAAALAGALWLTVGEERARAYVLSGDALGVGQRDFRVFDNFADDAANNNNQADPNFPGYKGATLAIWKAAAEWGSDLRVDGSGDPSQPGDLGSGGANFDLSFQGHALGVGTPNDNVHSAISGCAPGTLAYTTLPSSNGWSVRYCDGAWTFDDGPGVFLPGGNKDLQGTAAHEIGHTLGLGHSQDGAATMLSGAPGNGVSWRSIEADDVAGLLAIYGAKSAGKPRVTGLSVAGDQVTVTGANFSSLGNEVWFTPLTAGGDGTPLIVADVPSDGTTLTATVPADAGPGDVLVRNAGVGFESLSNPWPFAPTPPACGATTYGLGLGGANIGLLDTADAPLTGQSFTMDLSGFSGDGVALLVVTGQPANGPGAGGTVLVYKPEQIVIANVPITAGVGALTVTLPAAGAEAYLQAGFPDTAQPFGWALTNGLHIRVCP